MSQRTLGSIVSLQRGNSYKSKLLGTDGPKLLGLASIARDGGFRADNLRSYSGPTDERHLLYPGDIYVSLKDVTQSGDLLGSVARVPDTIALGRLTQDTVKLNFTDDNFSREYLYWVLRTPQYREYCRSRALGTTNLSMSREDFLGFELPPFSLERETLTELLESIEEMIELNRRMSATLEEMARALYRSWFVDFDPVHARAAGKPPAHMDTPTAALFPDSFGPDGLPEGWHEEPIIDQASWVNGAAYKNMHFSNDPDALPVVKIAELKAGITPGTKFTATDLGTKYRIEKGELLFSWSGNPDTSIDAFIWPLGNAWLNQHIFAVRENGKAGKARLFAMLRFYNPEFAEIARNKQTTGLGHITRKDLEAFPVSVATADITRAFEAQLEPIFQRYQTCLYENITLAALRDALLPRLMSGELRVREAVPQVEEVV